MLRPIAPRSGLAAAGAFALLSALVGCGSSVPTRAHDARSEDTRADDTRADDTRAHATRSGPAVTDAAATPTSVAASPAPLELRTDAVPHDAAGDRCAPDLRTDVGTRTRVSASAKLVRMDAEEELGCRIRAEVLAAMRAAAASQPRTQTVRVQTTFGGWGGDATPSFVDARLSSTDLREAFVHFVGDSTPPTGIGFGLFEVTGHYTDRWHGIRDRGIEDGIVRYYPIFEVDSWCYAGRPGLDVGLTAAEAEELFYVPPPTDPRCAPAPRRRSR